MSKIVAIPFVILFSLLSSEVTAGNVAVIDLDAVARELNMLRYLEATLQTKQTQARQELITAQSRLRGQLDQAQSDLTEKPSVDEAQDFLAKNRQLQSTYQLEVQDKQREIQTEHLRLINEFHRQLKPIALKVAKSKGCDVVLTNTAPPLFDFQKAADITEEVVSAAKQAGLARALPTQ